MHVLLNPTVKLKIENSTPHLRAYYGFKKKSTANIIQHVMPHRCVYLCFDGNQLKDLRIKLKSPAYRPYVLLT